MKKLLQNIFFASCLLLITGAVEAQTEGNAKKASTPPLPRTEEIREQLPVLERENTSPEEKMIGQKEKQQELEQQARKQQEELELQKAQEVAAAKERELEKATKVINPNWRNKKNQEELISEAKRAEVEAINQQNKEQRETEIKKTEQELQQTTDEGLKTKLQNKINNLRNHATEIGIVE